MGADVLVLRASQEQITSQRARAKALADLERVRKVAEAIRRMTRIYQERLDGRRVQ